MIHGPRLNHQHFKRLEFKGGFFTGLKFGQIHRLIFERIDDDVVLRRAFRLDLQLRIFQ